MPAAAAPTPVIFEHTLPYVERLQPRALDQVDLVVIHCTELPDLAAARTAGEQSRYASGTGNSGHYYIDRDGRIEAWVPLDRVAHHVRGYNARSIGIELVNIGRYPDWLHTGRQSMDEPYPQAQVEALVALLAWLAAQLGSLRLIEGHEQLDTTREPASDAPGVLVQRKLDPGPLFPWPQVLAATSLRRLGTTD